MSKCCKPQARVIGSTIVTDGSLQLLINKNFTSIGANEKFCLCIPFGFIPNQETALANPVTIVDPTGAIAPAKLVCTGNNLHVDSLRTFFLRNVCRHCDDRRTCCGERQINGCCTFNFNVFLGLDVETALRHVTFCHRMCPSIVGTAAVPDDDDTTVVN